MTDHLTGEVRTYDNTLGAAFQPIRDTSAFACFAAPPVAPVTAETESLRSRAIVELDRYLADPAATKRIVALPAGFASVGRIPAPRARRGCASIAGVGEHLRAGVGNSRNGVRKMAPLVCVCRCQIEAALVSEECGRCRLTIDLKRRCGNDQRTDDGSQHQEATSVQGRAIRIRRSART